MNTIFSVEIQVGQSPVSCRVVVILIMIDSVFVLVQECFNLFSTGGASKLADEFGLQFLGSIPLDQVMGGSLHHVVFRGPSVPHFAPCAGPSDLAQPDSYSTVDELFHAV